MPAVCAAPELPPAPPARRILPNTQSARDALALGAVYEVLRAAYPRSLPLGRWALAGGTPRGSGPGADLGVAVHHIFSYLRGPPFAQYDAAYNNLVPQARSAAVGYALASLVEITHSIDGVLKELKAPGTREILGRIAEKIRTEHAAVWPALTGSALPEDIEAVNKRHGGRPNDSWSPKRAYDYYKDFSSVTEGRTRQVRARIAAAVKAEAKTQAGQLLAILFYGRSGLKILDRLSRDPADGVAIAEREATEACEGARGLAQTVATDLQSVWRYPAFILGGLAQLGLLDERGGQPAFPGFAEYAVEIGALLGQSPLDRLLPVLGNALFVFSLFLPGGALVGGAARALRILLLAASGGADVAVGAVATAIDVARRREQEMAAQVSDVLPEGDRIAEHPEWGSVALNSAFLLFSAASFFRRGATVLSEVRGPGAPPPSSSTLPTEPRRVTPPSVPQPVRGRPDVQASPGSARRPAADPNDEARGLTDKGTAERGTANRATGGEPAPTPRDLEEEERIADFRREQGATPEQIRNFRQRWRQERAAARSRALARGRDARDDELEAAFREEPAAGGPSPDVSPPLTEAQLGLTTAQTAQMAALLGQRFDSARLARIGQAWDRIVSRLSQGRLAGRTGREAYEAVRPNFWAEIRRDTEAGRLFEEAGFVFDDARPRTAPYLPLPGGGRIRLTIDHIEQVQSAPGRSIVSSNLRLSFWRENTVVLRLLAELDPFQNPIGRGWSPFREFGRAGASTPEVP